MNNQLLNRNVVVTGASSGIGRAIAVACGNEGAHVILVGRNGSELAKTRSLLADPARGLECCCDLTDPEELQAQLGSAVRQTGPISGFVHSAGIASTVPLKLLNAELFRKEYSINVIAAFEAAKFLSLKKNCSPDGASFVFVASIAGHLGCAGKISYCASKGALLSGAKSLAMELAGKKIRVNTISPGYVPDTGIAQSDLDILPEETRRRIMEKHILGPGSVESVAEPVVFLLSEAARWITGTDLMVDGGFHLG